MPVSMRRRSSVKLSVDVSSAGRQCGQAMDCLCPQEALPARRGGLRRGTNAQAQPAIEASLSDATSAAWSAAPRGRAGGAAGGRSEQGDAAITVHGESVRGLFCGLPNQGNTCYVSAVMQLLFPVSYPSAAAVGSGVVSKISDSFSQLMAAMHSGNAAGNISRLKKAFMDALFSDSEVGSEKLVWSKFG